MGAEERRERGLNSQFADPKNEAQPTFRQMFYLPCSPRRSLSQSSLESKVELLSSSISSPRDRSETHISQSTSQNGALKSGALEMIFIQIPISEMEKLKPECTGQGQERDSNPFL